MIRAIPVILAVLLLACAPAAAPVPPPAFGGPEGAGQPLGHPLTGRIWRAADGAFVAPEELAQALAEADDVLLGEIHDNPDHHRIQAWAVGALFAAGRRPGLALEMVGEDRQEALGAYLRAHPGDADGLGPALGWEGSGWPAWRHYAPVVAPFAAAGLPIVGANLSRDDVRALARQGLAALTPARRAALGLDRPLPPELVAEIARDIARAHCSQVDEQARAFATVQIARDAALAQGLAAAAQASGDGAVLVAGTGHVRRDRGVPLHLARRGMAALTLAPVEVTEGRNRPEDYGAAFGAAAPPFDFVWFTPGPVRGEPCAGLEKK